MTALQQTLRSTSPKPKKPASIGPWVQVRGEHQTLSQTTPPPPASQGHSLRGNEGLFGVLDLGPSQVTHPRSNNVPLAQLWLEPTGQESPPPPPAPLRVPLPRGLLLLRNGNCPIQGVNSVPRPSPLATALPGTTTLQQERVCRTFPERREEGRLNSRQR